MKPAFPDELRQRLDEIEATMTGPNRLAASCEAMLPWLIEKRDAAPTKRERKSFSSRVRLNRELLQWATTRAGYVRR